MRRRTSAAALCLTLLAVIGVPAAAQADPFILSITDIAPQPGHPEILQVAVTSSADLDTVTAELHPNGGSAVSLKTTLTKVGDLWQTDAMTLPSLGYYTATVTVVDVDGETVSADSGSFKYLIQPVVIAHTLDTTARDPEHRTLHAEGALELWNPRTHTQTPAAGASVNMRVSWGSSANDYGATADADGHYSLDVTPYMYGDDSSIDLSADVSWNVGWDMVQLNETPFGQAYLDTDTITAQRREARFVMDATKVTVKYPTKAVVAGTLQQNVGGVWQPLPDFTVAQNNQGTILTQKTDASGHFSFAVAALYDGPYTVSIPWEADERFYLTNEPTGSTTVNVIERTAISWYGPKIDQDADLSLNGLLYTTSRNSPPTNSKVWVEQSSNGKTGWKTLGYVLTQAGGGFNDFGYLTNPSGYFRLVYNGSSTLQPSVSRVVHLSKIDTRVAGINASPEPISSGRTLTVKGTVQYLKAGQFVHVGANHYVQVFFRAKGSKTYTYKGQVKTTSTGTFAFHAKATKDGSWTAAWFPSSTAYVNAYGADDYVDVR